MQRLLSAICLILCGPAIALAQMGPAQVTVAPVELRLVELTQPLVANIAPVTRTTVAAEQEGVVEERLFDEGQQVKQGDLLVRVDTELLKAQRDATAAAKQSAEAELRQMNSELENMQREVDRLTELFEQRVAPEKEYRDALTMRDVGIARVAGRQAQVAQREAELQRLEAMLRKAETRSPLSGVVARRHVEVGEWIEQGAPIAELLQLDPLFVEINVPEEVITRVRLGDSARVHIDAIKGQTFTGKIDQILPQADPSSRTFRVKILLPNPDLAVWPGFFARAVLTSASPGQMFVVPRDALVTREGRTYVVAVRDQKAAMVPVQVGPAQGETVAVTGDLRDGESVVIRGNESLMPDAPLMVLPAPGAAAPRNGAANAPATQPQSGG